MKVAVLQVPYDSGHREARTGRGPGALVESGLVEALRRRGHEVSVEAVETDDLLPVEVATMFGLYRKLADRVRAVRAEGAFPLVLSGNCGAALGVLAGLGSTGAGVVWFDTHGDFNTPETTTSGFLDGMGLATATGRGWQSLAASIARFVPVPAPHVVLVAVRDLDPAEQDLLDRSDVAVIPANEVRTRGVASTLGPALDALRAHVQDVYLHFDLDALDPHDVGKANELAAPDGLSAEQAEEAILAVAQRFDVRAATIASYDPAYDDGGHVAETALRLVDALLAAPPPP